MLLTYIIFFHTDRSIRYDRKRRSIPLSFDQAAKLEGAFGIRAFRVVIDEPLGVFQGFFLLTGLKTKNGAHESVMGCVGVDGQYGVEVMQGARRIAISAGDA